MRLAQLQDTSNVSKLITLTRMLRTCRPMNSRIERAFREQYLLTLPGCLEDHHGNLHIKVPCADGSASRVLWSCHTDTVHWRDGYQPIDIGDRFITLADRAKSNCLGADDTVGVWLMREMILARVPGHYVFHYGEECGGLGSSAVVWREPERFDLIDCAIAFDRRGQRDVITHQAYGRTCSDAFAKSLAKQLRSVARYRPSDEGIYTDTAEYASIVPECTNVSVGYQFEHTKFERVNYWHAIRLLFALQAFDERKLVIERLPDTNDWDDVIDLSTSSTRITDWRLADDDLDIDNDSIGNRLADRYEYEREHDRHWLMRDDSARAYAPDRAEAFDWYSYFKRRADKDGKL